MGGHLEPLEGVKLLLGFIPAGKLGSEGQTVGSACSVLFEGLHHLQETGWNRLVFLFIRAQEAMAGGGGWGGQLTFSLGKLGSSLASSSTSDVGRNWLPSQHRQFSPTPDVASEYSDSEDVC